MEKLGNFVLIVVLMTATFSTYYFRWDSSRCQQTIIKEIEQFLSIDTIEKQIACLISIFQLYYAVEC